MHAREQTLDTDWSLFADELAEGGADNDDQHDLANEHPGSGAGGDGLRLAWHILKRALSRRRF